MADLIISEKSTIQVSIGDKSFECDPIEVGDTLSKIRESEGDDFLPNVQGYLRSLSDVHPDLNQAIEFNDTIVGICNELTEARKKKVQQTVSSLFSTRASPETSGNGTAPPSEPGLTTTEPPEPVFSNSSEE